MRRIVFSALVVCPPLAEFCPAQSADPPASFAPQALVLTPEPPPEFPLPEKSRGEPLPAPQEKALLVEQALQLAPPPLTHPDEDRRRAQTTEFFTAVAEGNHRELLALLAAGAEVNATLPLPADPAFAQRFRGSHLHYFVTVEPGLTPLMLAAGRGDATTLRILLDHGASPSARTKRHKTFALWLAGKGGHVEAMQTLLGVSPGSDPDRVRIEVDLAAQQAVLLRDGAGLSTAPISSGRSGFRTQAGEYVVTDKHRKWRSTLYPANMPFFMRLSCGEIGFHEGKLPGRPASHGCIRLRRQDAAEFFKQVPVGTKVIIK